MRSHSAARSGRRFGFVALTLASAACASAGHRSGQPAASLVFRNESPEHATVYVVAPGVERRRIGTVIPGQTETLTVPSDLAVRGASLNVVAGLIARGERPQTLQQSRRPSWAAVPVVLPDGAALQVVGQF